MSGLSLLHDARPSTHSTAERTFANPAVRALSDHFVRDEPIFAERDDPSFAVRAAPSHVLIFSMLPVFIILPLFKRFHHHLGLAQAYAHAYAALPLLAADGQGRGTDAQLAYCRYHTQLAAHPFM